MENILVLHEAMKAIGLSISGCSSDGTVHIASRPTCPEGEEATWVDPTDTLVELCLAAHEKSLSSDECLALQQSVTELQWANYIAARQAPIKAQREARYRSEADPLYLKLVEEAAIANTTIDISSWLLLKAQIRNELPYSD